MIVLCKKQLKINRIGNKNCWIKNGFQHWWFINRGYAKVFINLGDHLFLNYQKKWAVVVD